MFPKSSPHIRYLPRQKESKPNQSKLGTRSKSKFRKYVDYPIQNNISKLADTFLVLPTPIYNQINKLQRLTLQQIQSLEIYPPSNQQLDLHRLKQAVLISQINLNKTPKPKLLIQQQEPTKHQNLFYQEEPYNFLEISQSIQHQIQEQNNVHNLMRLQSDSSDRDMSKRFKTQNNILYFHEQSPIFD